MVCFLVFKEKAALKGGIDAGRVAMLGRNKSDNSDDWYKKLLPPDIRLAERNLEVQGEPAGYRTDDALSDNEFLYRIDVRVRYACRLMLHIRFMLWMIAFLLSGILFRLVM